MQNTNLLTIRSDWQDIALDIRTILYINISENIAEIHTSGGMRRRTAILRAILAPSDLVLMDEPFTGLDHETKLSAIRMIREFCDGKLFIAATHAEEDPKLLGAKVIQL